MGIVHFKDTWGIKHMEEDVEDGNVKLNQYEKQTLALNGTEICGMVSKSRQYTPVTNPKLISAVNHDKPDLTMWIIPLQSSFVCYLLVWRVL